MSGRRQVLALVVVLVVQLLLLAAQVPARGGAATVLDLAALRVLGPLGTAVDAATDGSVRLKQRASTRAQLQFDNDRLRAENTTMRQELLRLRGIEEDAARLARAVGYQPPAAGQFVVGEVVYADTRSWLQTLVVRAPAPVLRQPKVDAPVTAYQGLVGRTIAVAGDYVRVQLLTDRMASAAALIERTRRQGVIHGTGGDLLDLAYFPVQADVRLGDRVVTAGIDGIFPRGLPIGEVVAVAPGDDLFQRIQVAPAVDFRTLEQVFVLLVEAVPPALLGEPNVVP